MLLIEDLFLIGFAVLIIGAAIALALKAPPFQIFFLGCSVYLYNNSAWRDPFSYPISSS